MNYYLAIDPGDTTGICMVQWTIGWPYNRIKVLSSEPWADAQKAIENLLNLDDVDVSFIVERSPIRKSNNEQIDRVNWVINKGKWLSDRDGEPRLVILSPGDWKPVAKARKWRHPAAKDKHQIDAFNLFRYYIWRRWRIEVDNLPIEGKELKHET